MSLKKIIVGFVLFTLFTGCKKYPDDPWYEIHFRTPQKRLVGTWDMTQIKIDGADLTSLINVDSLKIFSRYRFYPYNESSASSYLSEHYRLEVSTVDGKIVIDTPAMQYLPPNSKNGQSSGMNFLLYADSTYSKYNDIHPYGAINYFFASENPAWEIRELTNKKLNLRVSFHSVLYELFFNKTSK